MPGPSAGGGDALSAFEGIAPAQRPPRAADGLEWPDDLGVDLDAVILKIPVVYLCLVVWWAIRSEPGRRSPREDRSGRARVSGRVAVLAGAAARRPGAASRHARARVPAQGRARGGAAVSTPEVSANRDRVDTLSG
jgi:hypothetical protein